MFLPPIRFFGAAILLAAAIALATSATAADWMTAPSNYTHSPETGQRIAQYEPIGPYYYYHRPDFQRSGYRHLRSSLQFGNSADNLHIVEEWGNPVRPYEEWRLPFKPYSVPYQGWGAPFAGAGGGGFGGYGGGYGGGPGGGFPGGGYPNTPGASGLVVPPGAGYIPQQSQDGYWPSYDRNDRSNYYRPYRN